MERYPVGLVPGPVRVPEAAAARYGEDYGSPDLEGDFLSLYRSCEAGLARLLHTENPVAIQCGEGMLALWGALNSVLAPGDRLLAVSSGVFGSGFAEMGRALGLEVRLLEFPFSRLPDPEEVRQEALRFRPRMMTVVHCETPSGTLTPLEDYGRIAREAEALLCVDFVASAGGAPVRVDDWGIDLGLLGSQKCLSLPPDLCFTSLSPRAREAVRRRGYQGYDALAPFEEARLTGAFPYTHHWRGLAALRQALDLYEEEGQEAVWSRHARAAARCRSRLADLGVALFPEEEAFCSPTVTAARVPEGWTWEALDGALRRRGVVLGGNYGPLAGKVFRFGHMGTQASLPLVDRALDALGEVLAKRP